jgi:hypothetical protein
LVILKPLCWLPWVCRKRGRRENVLVKAVTDLVKNISVLVILDKPANEVATFLQYKITWGQVGMKDIDKQIEQYFGGDVSRMGLLGITKYAVATYVLRVQSGWSKGSAIKALLLGRKLAAEEVRFVHSVLDRLPSAAVRTAGK